MIEKERGDASNNILEQIDKVAREFRKQISQGKSPRIEKHLGRVPESGRASLFSNLLDIEVSYLRSKGESPTSDSYLKRFPHFRTQVRRAFFEPTMDSVDAAASTDGDDHTESLRDQGQDAVSLAPTYELPDANRLGDYELIRELGRGGMGIVYEARHTKSNNRVALKTLPSPGDGQQVNADKLYRFRREFRRLSEINHPNLVGMQSLEVERDKWFFTMDLINGEDFLSYVRPDNQLDKGRLRSCLKQLAAGVIELHGRGIIHRDLKPSNVLVSGKGHVTILDFGLAAQLQRDGDMTQTKSGMFAGTPTYAAPEQMFGERTEASDWYAFGTMLFEALAGERPFQDSDQMALLRRKQEQDPPKLADRNGLPNDLSDLADGLLLREPSLRLMSDAIGVSLGLEGETRFTGSTRDSHGSTDSTDAEAMELGQNEEEEIVLIGREKQLAQLEEIKREFLEARQPQVVWVNGLSGEGKSSLVETFLRPIRREGDMLALSGRCYERESVPFKAVDCWIDPLVTFLRRKSNDWLQQNLPSDLAGLARIFPALQRVEAIRQLPSIESELTTPEMIRHRSFGALRDLMNRISVQTPIVIFIDDLQWGDAESAASLEQICSGDNAPTIMLVGTLRSEERSSSEFLKRWNSTELAQSESQIEVGPLTEEQARQLLSRIVPDSAEVPREEWHRVYQESVGNPYFLSQMLDSYDHESRQFRPLPVEDMISERLKRLPPEAGPLLDVLAVGGHDLPISLVAKATGIDSPLATLHRMRNEKLLRLLGSDEKERVDTFHDKIRETRMEMLPVDGRRTWHLRIADLLVTAAENQLQELSEIPVTNPLGGGGSRSTIPALPDVAYHYSEANDPKAFRYQIWAGEQALNAFLNDDALYHFNRAQSRIDESNDQELHFRITFGLGLATLRAGQAEEATHFLEDSIKLASSPTQRAGIYSTLSIAHQLLGRNTQALVDSEQALAELGSPLPKSTLARLWLIVPTLLSNLVSMPRGEPDSKQDVDSKTSMEMQVLFISQYQSFESNTLTVLTTCCRLLKRALGSSNPELVRLARTQQAFLLGAIGLHRRSHRVLHDVLPLDRRPQAIEARSRFSAWVTMCHYMAARYEEAIEEGERTLDLAIQCGDISTLTHITHVLRHIHAWSGTTGEELAMANRVVEVGQSAHAAIVICWGWYDRASALVRAGRLSEATESMRNALHQFGLEAWPQTWAICGGVHGYFRLQCSDHMQARRNLEAIWRHMKRRTVINEFTMPAVPHLLESALGPEWLVPLAKREAKLPRALVRWSSLLFHSFPSLQPSLSRTSGRFHANRGAIRKAIRCFSRSAKTAKRQGMPYFRAKALLDLAAVKEEGRDENRAEAIELLKKMESVIPRAESWLLGDQYDEAVVAPEFDLEAWEREHGRISTPLEAEND